MTYGKFLFAIGIIASGVLMFVNGGFYSPWVPVTKWIPGHVVLGYASAAILTIGGVGLLVKATAERSAHVLFWFLLAFLIVMKTPPALAEANVEVHWLDEGQIAVLVAGALTLAATKQRQLLAARYLCGAALIPIGLSHFFYWKISMTMVPSVLPYPKAWVMFTGTAHIAAGLGLLTGVRAWLAATLEGAMLTAFAVLVWLGPLLGKLGSMELWVDVVVTIAVANAMFAVASRIPKHQTAEPLS